MSTQSVLLVNMDRLDLPSNLKQLRDVSKIGDSVTVERMGQHNQMSHVDDPGHSLLVYLDVTAIHR